LSKDIGATAGVYSVGKSGLAGTSNTSARILDAAANKQIDPRCLQRW
jgi:hypothetical protein